MKYTSPKYIKQVLSEKGFSPLKKFGQNFLIDENIIKKILKIAEADNKNIIEVGPGLGALSSHILLNANKLVAIEIDKGFFKYLNDEFADKKNFKVINNDVLDIDIEKLVRDEFEDVEFILVANLPYYITTPCIMKFLNANINIKRMVVMVQKEVAKRLCANPGDSDYGSLTAIVNFFGKPQLEMVVSRNCFLPMPNVDSAVISIDIDKNKNVDAKLFIDFVRSCFKMKRKTLVNNLKKLGFEREQIVVALSKCGIKENVRAEVLSVDNFIDLINCLT